MRPGGKSNGQGSDQGQAEQAKGIAKEKSGRAMDDPELEGEGTIDRAAGEVREAVGDVKDKAKRAIDEIKE